MSTPFQILLSIDTFWHSVFTFKEKNCLKFVHNFTVKDKSYFLLPGQKNKAAAHQNFAFKSVL